MMRAGTYWVGDLCYVMHPQWNEVCNLMFNTGKNRDGVLDGEFNLANGVRFAVQSTAYGDGTYYDAQGREYGVDAGLIGCIAVEDIQDDSELRYDQGGHIITFDNPFTVVYDVGTILFVEHGRAGDKEVVVAIETAPEYAEDDEEYA